MTTNLADFRRHRSEGVPFSCALAWARAVSEPEPEIPPGYEVTVSIEEDDLGPEDLGLGRFTDRPRGFAFQRQSPGWNEHRYFVPENDPEEERASLSRLGYPKHEAYRIAMKQARETWKRAESFGSSWTYKYIVVRVYVHGREMGSASCGGYDGDEDYLRAEARTLTRQAIDDARAAVADFCRKVCGCEASS